MRKGLSEREARGLEVGVWKGDGHVVKRQDKGWTKQEQELQIVKQLFECKHQGGKRIV